MKLKDQFIPFLEGKTFSNSLKIPYDFNDTIPDRVDFLVGLTKGKRVVHLGCLDHQPLIESKIKNRKWLHKELSESSAKCIGIDIDQETKDYVCNTFGFNNIIISDFTREKPQEVINEKWDYAILGELLEHIDNPVKFLESIRINYTGTIGKIVITVPNAWTRTTMKMASDSIEIINSDHRYWFTPYTLSKVMFHAGIKVDEIYFTNRVPLDPSDLLKHKLLMLTGSKPKYNFTYASSIVAIGDL